MAICDCEADGRRDLYIVLMYRNRDSHRFFILALLFDLLLQKPLEGSTHMLDLILSLGALALFVASIGYAYACERL